jgi:hypothetical protein
MPLLERRDDDVVYLHIAYIGLKNANGATPFYVKMYYNHLTNFASNSLSYDVVVFGTTVFTGTYDCADGLGYVGDTFTAYFDGLQVYCSVNGINTYTGEFSGDTSRSYKLISWAQIYNELTPSITFNRVKFYPTGLLGLTGSTGSTGPRSLSNTIYYGLKGNINATSSGAWMWPGTQSVSSGIFPDPGTPPAFYYIQQPCTLSGIYAALKTAPTGTGTSLTLTVQKTDSTNVNASPYVAPTNTLFTVTFGRTDLVKQLYSGTVQFNAGDRLHLYVTYAGTGNLARDITCQLNLF